MFLLSFLLSLLFLSFFLFPPRPKNHSLVPERNVAWRSSLCRPQLKPVSRDRRRHLAASIYTPWVAAITLCFSPSVCTSPCHTQFCCQYRPGQRSYIFINKLAAHRQWTPYKGIHQSRKHVGLGWILSQKSLFLNVSWQSNYHWYPFCNVSKGRWAFLLFISTNSLFPIHYVDGSVPWHHFFKESYLFYIFIGEPSMIWLLCFPISFRDLSCGFSILLKWFWGGKYM